MAKSVVGGGVEYYWGYNRINKLVIEEIKSTNPLDELIKKEQLTFRSFSCKEKYFGKVHYVGNGW